MDWGWCVGRCAAPIDPETSNFSVRYAEWVEDQVLVMDAYNCDGAHGSWVQLEHDTAPIDDYQRGKYLVSGTWRRAVDMVFYSPEELARARELHAEERAEASQVFCCTVGQHVV